MSRTATTVPALALLLLSSAVACDREEKPQAGAGPRPAAAEAKDAPFTFDIEATNGMTWSNETPKARVKKAKGDYVSLKGTNFSFRIMGYGMSDAGPAESTELGYNNTFLHFEAKIGEKRMMIGCHPERDTPKGKLVRTKLDDDTVEGRFELELVQCNDYMTGKPVAYDGVPFTASGTFSLPLSK